MVNDIGKAFDQLFANMIVVLFISIPLAIWKIVDIVVWVLHHISIGIK
jgi:hypothetical protein